MDAMDKRRVGDYYIPARGSAANFQASRYFSYTFRTHIVQGMLSPVRHYLRERFSSINMEEE